LKFKEA